MRRLYLFLIRLHPKSFRERFQSEMLWLFDRSLSARGLLIADCASSLLRQWILRPRHWTDPCSEISAAYSGTPTFFLFENRRPPYLFICAGTLLSMFLFSGIATISRWSYIDSIGRVRIGLTFPGAAHSLAALTPVPAANQLTAAQLTLADWIANYNSGDPDQMRRFIAERFSTERYSPAAMELTAGEWVQWRSRLGPLRFSAFKSSDSDPAMALVQQSDSTWWRIDLYLSHDQNPKVLDIVLIQLAWETTR